VYTFATRAFIVRRAFFSGAALVFGFGTWTPRLTPASAAHLLAQLCGTPCSRAAALMPFDRTVASTAFRSSLV
jgi:hypothetical protein